MCPIFAQTCIIDSHWLRLYPRSPRIKTKTVGKKLLTLLGPGKFLPYRYKIVGVQIFFGKHRLLIIDVLNNRLSRHPCFFSTLPIPPVETGIILPVTRDT